MSSPIITNVEMAKNLVKMYYDANLIYEDEFDCEYERFKKLFERDGWVYFDESERILIHKNVYNVFCAIQFINSDKNIENPIYEDIKWENDLETELKLERRNQITLLREGLKISF